jgi:hypothetical protein
MLLDWWWSMTSNSDELEEQLQQNLRLRRELGAEIAKARWSKAKTQLAAHATDSSGKQDDKTVGAPQYWPPELATTEAGQEIGPRTVFWVLIGSVIAGLALALAYGWIPISWTVRP